MMVGRTLLLGTLVVAFGSIRAQSHDNVIITSDYDTLEHVQFDERIKLTNYSKITFEDTNNNRVTLSADEVYAYFDGQNYYLSKAITGYNNRHLLDYLVIGPAKFAVSNVSGGRRNYYMQYEDGKVFMLQDYRFTLDSLFGTVLPEYDTFRVSYPWRLTYDNRSIGELVSHYNRFKSDTYETTYFMSDGSVNFSPFLGVAVGNFTWNGEDFISAAGAALGGLMRIDFNPYLHLNTLIYHNKFEFVGNRDVIDLSNVHVEFYLAYRHYLNPKLSLNPGFGVFGLFNYSGAAYNPRSVLPIKFHIFSGGLRGSVDVQYLEKYALSVGYVRSGLPSRFDILTDSNRAFGTIHSLRVAFMYFIR